ncbi:MAG: hypothetical protein K2Y27_32170, partial [Xanthobacteraceae bacterium]|nr:hypothetical protein [Xanthobacteraceae bacterium]
MLLPLMVNEVAMNAICRFLANAASHARRRSFLYVALLIPLLVALPASQARAISQDEAIDYVVEAAARAGPLIGISVPDGAKELLKELIKCGANGTPIIDCAKQSMINVLLKNVPNEGEKMVGCMLGGGDVLDCAKKAGLDNLPPQAKPVVECMLGGSTVAACAGKAALGEALAKVPADVRPLLECIAGGKNPAECGAQAIANGLPDGEAKKVASCILEGTSPEVCAARFGTGVVNEETKKDTAALVDKLKAMKADAEQTLNEQEGSVRSFIMIAKAIQEGNVGNIVFFGGKEFAKVVVTIVIEVLCPPCGLIAGPVVAAMIDTYADLAEDVFKVITSGDLGKLPEILFEFYFKEMIARPCELLPDGGFKDAICGNLAKLIAAAAGVFGDAVGFILGVAEDILKAVGIWQAGEAIVGLIGDAWDAIFGDGLEDPKVCGPGNAFFAKNYLPCLGATAGVSAAASPVPALHKACVENFKPCYKDPEAICNGLDKALNDNAEKVKTALEQGARDYTPAVGAYIYARRAEFCTNGKQNSVENFRSQVSEFTGQCSDALGKTVPLQVAACTFKSPTVERPPGPSLACSNAVENSNWERIVEETCEKWCREDRNNCRPPPPPCFVQSGTVVESYGFTYFFSPLERSICVAKFPIPLDKIGTVINPPNVIYDNRPVVSILQNPAVRNPAWSGGIPTALNYAVAPDLSLGNCRATRTMLTPNVQWLKTPVRPRLTQAVPQVQQAPLSDASRATVSSMFAIRPTPAMTETMQLSLTPVALVPSFESCPGTASLASRGSSGSDGSYTPRSTVTRTTPARGTSGASAVRANPQGTSGSYTSRSGAMDRL